MARASVHRPESVARGKSRTATFDNTSTDLQELANELAKQCKAYSFYGHIVSDDWTS